MFPDSNHFFKSHEINFCFGLIMFDLGYYLALDNFFFMLYFVYVNVYAINIFLGVISSRHFSQCFAVISGLRVSLCLSSVSIFVQSADCIVLCSFISCSQQKMYEDVVSTPPHMARQRRKVTKYSVDGIIARIVKYFSPDCLT